MLIKLLTPEECQWLARQRPHHKRQNRNLLLHAKKARKLLEQLEGGMKNNSTVSIS
ncbi:hypothetical protein [Paenibacillus sp. LjRoot56]|uniref:hypothetical protein n=1 Tax=Paenibacillus sp. LjRoot56 TaxID=3342333 RepID=UPI003ECF39AB